MQKPNVIKIISGNWKFILILLFLTLGLYANTFNNQLTLVDDMQAFQFNPETQNLVESLKTLNIQKIIYAVSYQLFEFNPLPIRIVSVTLHLIITLLVFLFVYLVWDKKTAKIASLVFAVHSINTEAVTWISGAPYLYYALFNFIIFILYVLYQKGNGKKYLYIALGVYVVEMLVMRSPWVLVPPMALLVLDQMILRKKFDMTKIWWVALFAIPISIYLMVYFEDAYLRRLEARSAGGTRITMHTQALTPVLQGYPYSTHLLSKLYLFPKNLTVYYDGMEVTNQLLISMYFSFVLYIGVVVYFYFKNRQVSGILILLPVLIAPAYSPIKITWFLAERYLYSGTAFVGVLVAMGTFWLKKKTKNTYIAYGLLGIILVLLSVRTFIRNEDWQNTKTLSYANIKASPLSVRPYNDMGGHFYYEGDYKSAIEWYERALTVVPSSGTAINNLGFLYFEFGPLMFWEDFPQPEVDIEKAESLYRQGLRIMEDNGDPRTVSYFFNKSLAYNPQNIEVILQNADMYEQMGFVDHAKALYIHALQVDSGNEFVLRALERLSQ